MGVVVENIGIKEQEFIDLLLGTGRKGIEELIDYMKENGFFLAPCSGGNHLCKQGGLLEHSLNVYITLHKLDTILQSRLNYESMVICSLLHDLGKMGDHGKPCYVENRLASGLLSEKKPYKNNPELTYEEHEIRSLLIAERFIHLDEEEETAILHHNGLFGKLDSSYGNHNYDSSKLAFLLHTADMYCSRFIEVDETEVE